MFCTNCGNPIPDGMSFCTNCGSPAVQSDQAFSGRPIDNLEEAARMRAQTTGQPYVPPETQPYVQPGAYVPARAASPEQYHIEPKKKSRAKVVIVALLIALVAAGGIALAVFQPWKTPAPANPASAQSAVGATTSKSASSVNSSQSTSSAQSSQQAAASGQATGSASSGSSASSANSANAANPVGATPPKFTDATASSMSDADEIDSYKPTMVLDGNVRTAWNSDGSKSKTGAGQWIELESPTLQHVSGIKILPGFCKSEEVWSKNRRPHDITISFSDGTSVKASLSDEFGTYQTVSFANPVDTTKLRITIDSTYSPTYDGRTYDDCCISEIEVF